MTPARVFVDGYNLALEQGTGVATYARTLCTALKAMDYRVGLLYGQRSGGAKDLLLREIGFFDPPRHALPGWLRAYHCAKALLRHPSGLPAWQIPASGSVIANDMADHDELWNVRDLFNLAYPAFDALRQRMTVRLPDAPPDIMHWTYPLPVRLAGARNIYTMHDLVPLRLPFTTLDNKRRYLRLCRMLARKADHIVTVSEASRRDIIALLGVDGSKVTNTFQAADIRPHFAQTTEAEAAARVSGAFGLGLRGYYLFVGAIEPKKNVGRLIEAYLASGVDSPLVIAGKQAWKSDRELRLMVDDNVRFLLQDGPRTLTRHRVVLLDYVPRQLLLCLIKGAKALLFPSLYEGFGLPVLEAMHLGTPVVTSNTASLPEIAGDAAICIDPYDVRALRAAILAIDADAPLRQRLAVAGLERADLFSQQRYQDRLRSLHERL